MLLIKPRWQHVRLKKLAEQWLKQMKQKKSPVSEQSMWWDFLYYWPVKISCWLKEFIAGNHVFSPMQTYTFANNEQIIMWAYCDRLIVSMLLSIVRPLFPHIISKNCFHLKGPAGVKNALAQVTKALDTNLFRYLIRIDIASYYASIDHDILQAQVASHIDDPRLRRYLNDIITIGIEKNGAINLPHKGIPIRSSLSPFFGALYLSPLDKAMEHRHGVFYSRFMDDVLILIKTKRQFVSAKKRLRIILRGLKLKLSSTKTRMGHVWTLLWLQEVISIFSKIKVEMQSCIRPLLE